MMPPPSFPPPVIPRIVLLFFISQMYLFTSLPCRLPPHWTYPFWSLQPLSGHQHDLF